MITINIDIREKNLYNNIINRELDNYKNFITINYKTLDLGDIEILTDFNSNFIFERKTLSDLNSSIIDGRYKEQKSRLLSNYNPNNITYIIEGDTIIKSLLKDNKRISSTYYRLLFKDNIKIIFTNNIDETATIILSLCCKIIDNPDKYKPDNEINYIENVKIKQKKIDNITPENCYILQLSQIPTISHIIAKNIASKYQNFKILIEEIEKEDTYNNKIKLLTAIDKIGNEKAKKILQYLNISM